MFVTQRLRVFPLYLNISKRLLSNEIKQVLSTRLEPPAGVNGDQIPLALVSRNLNALNLDLFVNNLNSQEDRRAAVLDLLAQLRSSKYAKSCLESTNFAVVRHLLENSSVQELVPLLLDRPTYGIFLDNFTGFAVTEELHNAKEYALATPLVLKLILLDELDSAFIQAFCVKCSLDTLKTEIATEPKVEEETKPAVGKKQQEQKIRVKFLRNPLEVDVKTEIGKALLKISSKTLSGEVKDNAQLLGFVLTKRFEELEKLLQTFASNISPDVADISKELLVRGNQTDIANKLEQVAGTKKASQTFEACIDALLAETNAKDAKLLAERQTQLFPTWQKLREEKKLAIEKAISEKQRKETVEQITNEIASKKQLLWFFEDEDKLDLEIYKKRVFYPKKWFGKKKKPRVVDEHYVPPQIRKIH